MSAPSPLDCPHCGEAVFRAADGGRKLKARTSVLVLHKNNEAEINCHSCGQGVIIPMVPAAGAVALRKAMPSRAVRLIVPKA